MARTAVPERLRLAVERLDVGPDDQILEIGCGPGVAISLICQRLAGGRVLGIDRSAAAISRATARNRDHLADGRAELQQSTLSAFEPAQLFDKVFAVNVNAFWTGPANAELSVIERCLRPRGALYLFHEGPSGDPSLRVVRAVTAALTAKGFACDVETEPLLCITGRVAEHDYWSVACRMSRY